MAPISPFMVDVIHRNLTGQPVHQAAWPLGVPGSLEGATSDEWDLEAAAATAIIPPLDKKLEDTMILVRELAEAGRRIRVEAGRRQRLPCAQGWIVAGPDLSIFHDILAEELNVEEIAIEQDLNRFQKIELAPNFRTLAPKARAEVNAVSNEIKNAQNPDEMLAAIKAGGMKILGVEIDENDVEIRRAERDGFAAETVTIGQGEDAIQVSLVLDMQDTPLLLSKGLARDITRRIQAKRKEMDFEIEATIDLQVWLQNAPEMFESDQTWVATETRSAAAVFHSEGQAPANADSFTVDGITVQFTVE
jgi:isoleucyl-tRNA synthetase